MYLRGCRPIGIRVDMQEGNIKKELEKIAYATFV